MKFSLVQEVHVVADPEQVRQGAVQGSQVLDVFLKYPSWHSVQEEESVQVLQPLIQPLQIFPSAIYPGAQLVELQSGNL